MRSRLFSFNLIIVIFWLLSACAPAREATLLRDDEPLSQPVTQKNKDDLKPFFQALERANSATDLAKLAKTEAEWKAVTQDWDKAIALMKSVPKTDKNYAIAQQKISEYQKNLAAAQQQAKAAVSPQNE